jgi:predicted HTH domain antitoxin
VRYPTSSGAAFADRGFARPVSRIEECCTRLKAPLDMHEVKLQVPADVSAEEARLLLATKLYETGRLSLGQAAELSGFTKPTFMELLGRAGVAIFAYPPGELAGEVDP